MEKKGDIKYFKGKEKRVSMCIYIYTHPLTASSTLCPLFSLPQTAPCLPASPSQQSLDPEPRSSEPEKFR